MTEAHLGDTFFTVAPRRHIRLAVYFSRLPLESAIINRIAQSLLITGSVTLFAIVNAAAESHAGASAESQGMTWAQIARLPDFYSGVWDPVMGGAPPPGADPSASPGTPAPGSPGSTTEVAQRNCQPHSVEDTYGSPFPIEFLFTPGRVTLNIEYEHVVRRIYIGAKHPDDPDPAFMGDSIGHWEHGTLVVDTVGVKSIKDPDGEHSPHVLERIKLSTPELLSVEMTVQDGAQTKLTHREYRRQRTWTIHEYYCEENPRDTLDAQGNPAIRGIKK